MQTLAASLRDGCCKEWNRTFLFATRSDIGWRYFIYKEFTVLYSLLLRKNRLVMRRKVIQFILSLVLVLFERLSWVHLYNMAAKTRKSIDDCSYKLNFNLGKKNEIHCS